MQKEQKEGSEEDDDDDDVMEMEKGEKENFYSEICFPWNVPDSKSEKENMLNEGKRSLIIELDDSGTSEM